MWNIFNRDKLANKVANKVAILSIKVGDHAVKLARTEAITECMASDSHEFFVLDWYHGGSMTFKCGRCGFKYNKFDGDLNKSEIAILKLWRDRQKGL